MKVEWGTLVRLEFDAFLDSGEEFDCSELNGPLRIRIGEWKKLPGLGEKLVGLQAGDERLIRLTPGEAFGDWDPGAVVTMQESRLVGDVRVEEGMTLRLRTRDGPAGTCRVVCVSDGRVALDFNHPLAGEPVTLFVRVREVAQPSDGGLGRPER